MQRQYLVPMIVPHPTVGLGAEHRLQLLDRLLAFVIRSVRL